MKTATYDHSYGEFTLKIYATFGGIAVANKVGKKSGYQLIHLHTGKTIKSDFDRVKDAKKGAEILNSTLLGPIFDLVSEEDVLNAVKLHPKALAVIGTLVFIAREHDLHWVESHYPELSKSRCISSVEQ